MNHGSEEINFRNSMFLLLLSPIFHAYFLSMNCLLQAGEMAHPKAFAIE